jgi:Domain of unknown function (DUF4157)
MKPRVRAAAVARPIRAGTRPSSLWQARPRVSTPTDASERDAERMADEALRRDPTPTAPALGAPRTRIGATANVAPITRQAGVGERPQSEPESKRALDDGETVTDQADRPRPITTRGSVMRTRVWPKYLIGAPADSFEQEADAVAAHLVESLPASFNATPGHGDAPHDGRLIQRQVDDDQTTDEDAGIEIVEEQEDEEEEAVIQAMAGTGQPPAISAEVASQIDGLHGGGAPLSEADRAFFEPRLGRSLDDVRLHTGIAASELARSVRARAFTVGSDIVLGPDESVSGGGDERRLLAHELTHVVQQSTGRVPGAVQRQVVQRQPAQVATLRSVTIYLKTRRIVAVLSDGTRIRLILKWTDIPPGEYRGSHAYGSWRDEVYTRTGEPLRGDPEAPRWDFIHEEPQPVVPWKDIATSADRYELVIYGLRKEGTREGEIKARAKEGKGEKGGQGEGAAERGKGEGDEGTGRKPGATGEKTGPGEGGSKEGEEGAKGAQATEGGQTGETAEQRKARLDKLFDKLKELSPSGAPPLTQEAIDALAGMDAQQQADLLEYLQDTKDLSDEDAIDVGSELEKYLKMSSSDRELLRVNLELKKSKTAAGGLPDEVRIALEASAASTTKGPEAVAQVNKELANLAAIHRKVTHDTLIDKENASLEPIDLEKMPIFREMMMLEGLLAGASTKSPAIESTAKELTKSIAGIRDYVLEEILWLAGEMAASAIIGALTGPIGAGAAVVRGTLLLQRLNKLRIFLQRVESIYSTTKRIDGIIKKVIAGYEQYRRFKPQFDAWMDELETLRAAVEDLNADELAALEATEKLEAFEDKLIDEMHKQLEEERGLGAVLEYFDIPEDTSDEDLRQILFDIPRGFEELQRLRDLYSASGTDLDATKKLAYRSVLVGVLLYPFVGFLAKETGSKLAALMPEKDLGDRLLDVLGRVGRKHKGYKAPGKKATKAKLTKAKRPKPTKAEAEARKQKKAEAKAKKEAADKEDEAKAKDKKQQKKKEKDNLKDANEWSQVVKKVARLRDQHKEAGATEAKLKSQAKAIRSRHKKVAGRVRVVDVGGRGEWEVSITHKSGSPVAKEIVLMGYNERWSRAKKAIEDVVQKLPVEQMNSGGIQKAVDQFKKPYEFTSLKVVDRREAHRSGFTVIGAMGKMKDREILSTDDVTGLHTGDKDDPIPIYWYKDPSWYPGVGSPLLLTLDDGKRDFRMTDKGTVTLKSGQQVEIGVDPARIVKPGAVLKRRSAHDRDYTQVDRIKAALKQAGYSAWVNKDIDHVTDLAFEGTNAFSNLWPLNSEKNRHAFSGMWYRNYGIEFKDKKNPKKSKTSTLYKLQHKWYLIHAIGSEPEKLGGRTKGTKK